MYTSRLADKRAERRFPRAERCHVVADEVDYARCDKTRKRIKRGKIKEPWPDARGGIRPKISKQPAFPFMSYYAEARTHIGKCLTTLVDHVLTRSRGNIKMRPVHDHSLQPDFSH